MIGIEIALSGRVGKPPRQLTTRAGGPWTALSVAVGIGDDTTWVSVAAFGELAEIAAGLKQGTAVYVDGRLRLQKWTDAAGRERIALQMTAVTLLPLGQIGRHRPPEVRRSQHAAAPQRPLDEPPAGVPVADDPMPF